MDDSTHDTSAGEPPGVPRWLQLSLVVLAVVVLAVVVLVVVTLLALVDGEHGPGRHALGATTDVSVPRR